MSPPLSDVRPAGKPVVLTVAGLDPSGGAGVLADIRTFFAFDCFASAAITAITFQNTTGVFGAVNELASTVRGQVEPVVADLNVGAVKTGMLPTVEIVNEVAQLIVEQKLPRPVVDPVMISTSGHYLVHENAFEAIKVELLRLALVVTPNVPEAERLTGLRIQDRTDMRRAAEAIRNLGAKAVLIKGGHLAPTEFDNRMAVIDVFVDENGNYIELSEEFVPVGEVHGSGCVLSAAIASGVAKGQDLKQAIAVAKRYVTDAIRQAPKLGHGARPL